MPGRQLAEAVEERRRRDEVAAFALDRLHDNRGDFVRRDQVREELIFDVGEALGRGRVGACGAIRVRIRRVEHARHERAEAAALDRLACRERQRPHRTAVEGAQERDDALPPRVVAGQLDRRFRRLGARVGEERADVARRSARAPRAPRQGAPAARSRSPSPTCG